MGKTKPALYFSNESYSVSGPKLMGRQAAGEAFLEGFLAHYGRSEIDILLHSPKEVRQSRDFLVKQQQVERVNSFNLWQLEQFTNSTLYMPYPGIGDMAVHRAKIDEARFSLCGITHTTASHSVMETLSNLLTDPVRPWDALICTSSSVRQSVEVILDEKMDYLRWKLGATRFELPQLPVIPLGVHCHHYAEKIPDARAQLGIAPDDIVVIYVGRLSFHAKAHPHPMLAALEAAHHQRKNTQGKIHLLQCGWYANEHIEKAFTDLQRTLSPNVEHHYIDGRDKQNVKLVWSVADIFMSLSDNIQETFGLTPIEALAAGVPAIVSDWDGYKDTITHNETGFRVKTTMPSKDGVGKWLAHRYATGEDTYDMYCGHSCETISVDMHETTSYLVRLIDDPALRQSMGEAGVQRAKSHYDWSVIMRQYDELWTQLDHIRQHTTNKFGPLPHKILPQQIDPYRLFAHYPTEQFSQNTCLSVVTRLSEVEFERLINLKAHSFAHHILPKYSEVSSILNVFDQHPECHLSTLSEALPLSSIRLEITLSWLLKVGTLSLER